MFRNASTLQSVELNTFEPVAEPYVPPAVVTLSTVAVGLVAVVVAWAVDPLGPPFILVTWGFFLIGIALAVRPGRTRSVGVGLTVAGAALPGGAFLCLWVVVSVWALCG